MHALLNNWLDQSAGELIEVGNDRYWFHRNTAVPEEELSWFEASHALSIEPQLRQFLIRVGACTVFGDETLPGIEFLPPRRWQRFTQAVLKNTGSSSFPEVVLTVSLRRTGETAGFRSSGPGGRFGHFYPDIPPVAWLGDTQFVTFDTWLTDLMASFGVRATD